VIGMTEREARHAAARSALAAAGATKAEADELYRRVVGVAETLRLLDWRGQGDHYARAARAALAKLREPDDGTLLQGTT
jgi:hypothetical protein